MYKYPGLLNNMGVDMTQGHPGININMAINTALQPNKVKLGINYCVPISTIYCHVQLMKPACPRNPYTPQEKGI
jgi:hypothetical protein